MNKIWYSKQWDNAPMPHAVFFTKDGHAIHGTMDTYVAYEQSLWIIERLIAAGVPAELETISGAGHGFRGADAQRADARAIGQAYAVMLADAAVTPW